MSVRERSRRQSINVPPSRKYALSGFKTNIAGGRRRRSSSSKCGTGRHFRRAKRASERQLRKSRDNRRHGTPRGICPRRRSGRFLRKNFKKKKTAKRAHSPRAE